jgi:uncharacterized protein YcfJ
MQRNVNLSRQTLDSSDKDIEVLRRWPASDANQKFSETRTMNAMTRTTLAAAAAAGMLGVSASANAAEYARVVSATPVSESVAVPRQECVNGEQVVPQAPSGAGAAIGAIAGGVVGNQFGHGFGRAAATGLGAVGGAAIGNSVEASATPPVAVPVQHCRTVTGYQDRIVGYDVIYEYHGQRYSTRLPQDPGQRLAVDVRPAGNTQFDQGAPPPSEAAVPPAYSDVAPVGSDQAPVYYAAAPRYYYPPAAPLVYPAPYFIGPAIGFGLGYWAGRSWGWGHGYHHWH